MKIRLLIASGDKDYAEHLSNVLSENYADTFEVNMCTSTERLKDSLAVNRYDAMLLESEFTSSVETDEAPLIIVLWDGSGHISDSFSESKKILKYQQISSIVRSIMESYADVSVGENDVSAGKTHITAVWSPCGGAGKTTVSLAFAAHMVSYGKQAVYLNLENFSSTQVYFPSNGKSISAALEKLNSNVHMFLMSILQKDSGSGIAYFCGPDNYDDINILMPNDIETLVRACAGGADELVVDLSSQCDERVKKVFELADTVLLVNDSSVTSLAKLWQFLNQHDVSRRIYSKCVLVNNKGAKVVETGIKKTIWLPLINTADPISVYKTLSGSTFESR